MPAYIVSEVEVFDEEKFAVYRQLVPPTIAAHGGRYLVRGGALETLEGEWQPKRIVILEFPSAAQAKTWLDSDEYEDVKALRHASARTRMIVVEGL